MEFKVQYLIFFILALTYILFGYGVIVTNDSVTNVDQIVSLDLWSRSSHFSFHLFGIIFYLILSKLIGLSAVVSIEIMLAVVSAASASALYLIVLKKFNNVNQAVITVIIYAFTSGIFRFSCQVEYLVLVPSFGLISLYFYSKGQNVVAGIIFGFGILTSPFMVLFTPMFFLFTSPKELFKKHNIIFAVSIISIYLSINTFTFQETVQGQWSYGDIFDSIKETIGDINFLRQTSIYIYGYLRSFNIIIFILPFALYSLSKSSKELFYIFIIIILIHLPVIITEARYGGYQMTAYPIVAIASAFYLINIIKSSKWIITILLIFSSLNFYIVFSEKSFFRDLKETYVRLNNDLEDNSVLIVYQAIKPIQNIYAPNLKTVDVRTNYLLEIAKKNKSFVQSDLSNIIKNNDTVYLLESGQSMPDDNLKLIVSNFTKNQGAKVKGFALEKILAIDPTLKIEKLNQYSLDVYKISKTK